MDGAAVRLWLRRWGLAAGAVLLVGGSLLLVWSVLGSRVRSGAVGVLVAASGLALVNDQVRRFFADRWVDALGFGVATSMLTSTLVVVGIVEDSPVVAALGVVASSVAVLPVAYSLRVLGRHRPGWWVVLGLSAVVVGLALVAVGPSAMLGVALVLVGIGGYKFGLGDAVTAANAWWATTVAATGFVGGVLMMAIAVRASVAPLGALAAIMILLSLMGGAVSWPLLHLRPLSRSSVVVIGVLFLLAGVFVVWSSGQSDLAAWLIGAALAGFGWSLVGRGEGLVLGVVVGFVIVWALVDRTTERPPDPHPDADGRIVAFGDSYISGEGAREFFAGTNQVGDRRNECRRAVTAYPYLVADELGMGLDFLACSGAVTVNVVTEGVPQMPDSPDDVVGGRVQMAELPADRSDIRVALVSIGGNDARFSQIARGCLLPGTCDELRELWLGNVANIGPGIREVYREIRAALPGVPVVAMPYPLMITDDGCGWSLLDDREHSFLFEFVAVLNDQVRVAAAQEGVNFFEPGLFAFRGERICEGDGPADTVMNFITLQPPAGDFFDRLDPQKWIHGSMHPKADGHERTARRLAPYLEELLAGVADGPGTANPEPQPDARLEILGLHRAEPFPVDPDELAAPDGECGEGRVDPFGTRVLVFDDQAADDHDAVDRIEAPAVPISDADPAKPVCVTAPDGTWISLEPTDGGRVFASDGVVFVIGELPDEGRAQLVVYVDRLGIRRVRVLEFCSRSPGCPSTVDGWTDDQLADAAREGAPAVVLLILSGWLLGVGTRGVGERLVTKVPGPRSAVRGKTG